MKTVRRIVAPLFGGNAGTSWRNSNADFFPSDESLRHFFRSHKRELVEEGAVTLLRGQWHATDRMTLAVRRIADRAARRAVDSEGQR